MRVEGLSRGSFGRCPGFSFSFSTPDVLALSKRPPFAGTSCFLRPSLSLTNFPPETSPEIQTVFPLLFAVRSFGSLHFSDDKVSSWDETVCGLPFRRPWFAPPSESLQGPLPPPLLTTGFAFDPSPDTLRVALPPFLASLSLFAELSFRSPPLRSKRTSSFSRLGRGLFDLFQGPAILFLPT